VHRVQRHGVARCERWHCGYTSANSQGKRAPRGDHIDAKATLYTTPDDTNASRAYLVQNDAVTVLKQSSAGWTYVDYVNASGKHLLRWIKSDQLLVKQ